MIAAEVRTVYGPSDIVHHASYSSDRAFRLLCDAPWVVATSMYHVRVVTEIDSIGRSVTFSLTRDPVDCMTCLVAQASR